MAFSDGWKRQVQRQRDPELHNPIDPSHLTPQDTDQIWWADTSGNLAPGMPDAVVDQQQSIGTPTTHGYIDTTPQGGDFGMPAFPGVTLDEGQAIRGVAHAQDFGSFAARKYTSPPNRDGSLHIDDFPGPNNQGTESEQNTIRYETGTEAASDFGANRHRKIRRWRDRYIDFHWWAVEMNPSYVKSTPTKGNKPMVVQERNQAMSPFSAGDIYYDGNSFLVPQERRTPEPWDVPMIESGTPAPGDEFALGSWGL